MRTERFPVPDLLWCGIVRRYSSSVTGVVQWIPSKVFSVTPPFLFTVDNGLDGFQGVYYYEKKLIKGVGRTSSLVLESCCQVVGDDKDAPVRWLVLSSKLRIPCLLYSL